MKAKPFRIGLGDRGEMIAWDFLLRNGYRILEKNYRCPIGEIDVIAKKGKTYRFVEIKTRTADTYGAPEESVHQEKQRRLIRLAQWYLKEKSLEDECLSFDVVSILWQSGEPKIRLIENAFTADE